MAFTKLANSILTSTIWMEDDQTRIVWLTMLAMADKNGEVQASVPGLANIARVPVEQCREAIAKFLSPDPDSRTKTEEGRRIEEIRGGWVLINHAEYRELASDEDRKKKAAERQKRFRDRAKRNGLEDDSNATVTPVSPSRSKASACVSSESKKHRFTSELDSGFEEFWQTYPRRTAKGQARKAWAAAIKKIDAETILVAAERYAKQQLGKDQQFVRHPATWLNGECWSDETLKPKDPFWYLALPPEERDAVIRAEMAKP